MIEKYKNSRGLREKRVCENCKNDFITLSIKVRQGGEKFCSISCYYHFRKNSSKKQDNKVTQRKYKYGINNDTFEKMILNCNNSCEICGLTFDFGKRYSTPFIDHCHKTGEIRGLLCSKCNSGIGFLKDSEVLISNALNYILKYSTCISIGREALS